jgi:hypothetical protein
MRWAGHVAFLEEMINLPEIVVGKPEQKRQFGRPRYKWEDNIKVDLTEI